MDLIPSALHEITEMVNQIKRTTEKLNRRLHTSELSSDDELDSSDDMDSDASQAHHDVPFSGNAITEEVEEEVARRESKSIVSLSPPHESRNSATSSSRTLTLVLCRPNS